jgi:hypothetical protein
MSICYISIVIFNIYASIDAEAGVDAPFSIKKNLQYLCAESFLNFLVCKLELAACTTVNL